MRKLLILLNLFLTGSLIAQNENLNHIGLFTNINDTRYKYTEIEFAEENINNFYFKYGVSFEKSLKNKMRLGISASLTRMGYRTLYGYYFLDTEDIVIGQLPAQIKNLNYYIDISSNLGYDIFNISNKIIIRPTMSIYYSNLISNRNYITRINGEKSLDKGNMFEYEENIFNIKAKLVTQIRVFNNIDILITPTVSLYETNISKYTNSKPFYLGFELTMFYNFTM